MLTKKINGNTIELYDSIEDLPIVPFQGFNFNLLVDTGIGSDVQSLTQHMNMIYAYAGKQDYEGVVKELTNYHTNLNFIIQGINPKHNAFAYLVHSINGKIKNDWTDSGIEKTRSEIAKTGVTIAKVIAWIKEVKKNLMLILSFIFRDSRSRHEQKNITPI